MKLHCYIVLLRGINVGGNNIIKMADLKLAFEEMGFSAVTTYIQSGNVIFHTAEASPEKLTILIEKSLSDRFQYNSRIVIISKEHISDIVHNAPEGFGSEPGLYRYDVLFLRPPLSGAATLERIKIKEGVDAAYAGDRVLYFSRLISKATQSQLTKVVSMPVYKELTIRNWNTTTRLLTLASMEIIEEPGTGSGPEAADF